MNNRSIIGNKVIRLNKSLIYFVQVLSFFIIYPFIALPQYDPNYRLISDIMPSTMKCMVLDVNKKSTAIGDIAIDIYESGENTRDERDFNKKYVYIPSFYISRFSIDTAETFNPDTTISYILNLEIVSENIEKADIIRYIQRYNSSVKPDNINPVCFVGFIVHCPNSARDFIKISEEGSDISKSRPLFVTLEFTSSKNFNNAYKNLSNGLKIITLDLLINNKLTQSAEYNIDMSVLANSNVFKDFFSPVEGNTIWIAHTELAKSALVKELVSDHKIEVKTNNGEIDQLSRYLINKQVDTYINFFIKDYNETSVITFDQIKEGLGAASNLVSFSDQRYASDVLKEIAFKSKNSSEQEWESFYDHTLKNSLQYEFDDEGKWGGGINVMKLFDTKVDNYSKSSELLKTEFSELLKNSEKSRQFFENSFEYEQKGEVWIPKGIISTEYISNYSEVSYSIKSSDLIVNQITWPKTQFIGIQYEK